MVVVVHGVCVCVHVHSMQDLGCNWAQYAEYWQEENLAAYILIVFHWGVYYT